MPVPLRGATKTVASVRILGTVLFVIQLGWPDLGSAGNLFAQGPSSRRVDGSGSKAEQTQAGDLASKTSPLAVSGPTNQTETSPQHDSSSSGVQVISSPGGRVKPQTSVTPPSKPRTTLAKLNELRAETMKRIEALDAIAANVGDSKGNSGLMGAEGAKSVEDTKALKELLKARLDWMNKYEKAEKDYRQATGSKAEQEKVKAKADLERLNALLEQAGKSPTTLLPQVFRGSANEVGDSIRTEMREAIEATQNELKDWTTKLEAAKGEASKTDEDRASMRAERDKVFQRVAALKARAGEKAPGVAKSSAPSIPDHQKIEQERRLNLEWETQVETLQLMAQEAKIALAAKMTAVNGLNIQVYEAHAQIARKVLEQMQLRLRAASDLQQRDLKRAAATEEKRAAKADDPLERYRAQRTAELLEMEAQTVKFEQTLAANPSPSPEDQKALVDQARRDFEEIKQLLKDGQVSRLDAIRLNNDFRRIGPERDRVARNEMTTVEARVQFYGNALTEAELELIEDAHQDRFEHDALLERLPAARRPAAEVVFDEIERKHRAILIRRRDALKRLANRATETLKEVTSRLAVLDDEYGFIRTSIFWVRDQDPIGPETIGQGGQEIARLGKGLFRLVEETIDRRNWNQVSAEFVAATTGLLALPLGLFRIRNKLGRRIAIDLHEPTGRLSEPSNPTSDSETNPGIPQHPEPE